MQSCTCRLKPRSASMTGKHVLIGVGIAVSLAIVTSGAAKSAADKYTLKVPDGLAFAEFRGYEAWQTIAVSQNGGLFAVILGNPVMINAYKTGVPGNRKSRRPSRVSRRCPEPCMTLISW